MPEGAGDRGGAGLLAPPSAPPALRSCLPGLRTAAERTERRRTPLLPRRPRCPRVSDGAEDQLVSAVGSVPGGRLLPHSSAAAAQSTTGMARSRVSRCFLVPWLLTTEPRDLADPCGGTQPLLPRLTAPRAVLLRDSKTHPGSSDCRWARPACPEAPCKFPPPEQLGQRTTTAPAPSAARPR